MTKDTFGREKFRDMFNLYTLELLLYTILAFGYIYYFAVYKNDYVTAATALLVYIFLFYSSMFSLKYSIKNFILVPKTDLSVNCSALSFSLNGDTYNFCDILPTYTLTKYKFHWSRFNLTLKSGKELKFMLPKNVAESFELYVGKYSKAKIEKSNDMKFPS